MILIFQLYASISHAGGKYSEKDNWKARCRNQAYPKPPHDAKTGGKDYRANQNYVGQTVSYQKQFVHYVCPKPDDLPKLMEGLLTAHQVMKEGAIPQGLMFPVSAAMLKKPALYDHSLEAFSNPLMRLVEYDLDNLGRMTVPGETGRLYMYIDMTAQAEALYDFVKFTIEYELVEELDFLANYDRTKQAIQEIVDMPDRLIDLFIQLCLQNNGPLSARQRESHFGFLTDDELADMEIAVREGYARNRVSRFESAKCSKTCWA